MDNRRCMVVAKLIVEMLQVLDDAYIDVPVKYSSKGTLSSRKLTSLMLVVPQNPSVHPPVILLQRPQPNHRTI